MDTGNLGDRTASYAGRSRTRTLRDLRDGYLGLRRWLGGPLLRYQMAAATVVLLSSTLWSGLALDDFAQRMIVEQRPPGLRGRLDLYNLISSRPDLRDLTREVGTYFWWTGPDTKIDYWRPVAALTHFVDYSLWPRWAWLMHA